MSRAVPWVTQPSDIVKASIEAAKRKSFFILKQSGPTSFFLRDGGTKREQQAEGNGGSSSKNEYKVTLGAVHSCTCFGFRKEKSLCRHICWIILKKFKIPPSHPLIYQRGYVEREIDEVLRGVHAKKETKAVGEQVEAPGVEEEAARNRRDLDSEDVCPICQEELLEARLPVTWCQACSNAAHIRCMKVWAEHQETQARASDPSTPVQCPYCRQEFAPKERLRREFSNTWDVKKHAKSVHSGAACAECTVCPIRGKLYLATRGGVTLCGACYRGGARAELLFNVRERPGRAVKPAKRIIQNQQLGLELQGREITENDYDQLLTLDRPPTPDDPGVPEHILNLLPCHRVGANKRLLRDGIQCLICLLPYQPTQYVKKLPKCCHYFHRDCIDTWLQNHRSCPVCKINIALRQQSPKKTQSRGDILEGRHKVVNRTPKRNRLLDRRQSMGAQQTTQMGGLGDLLVTRPIQRSRTQVGDDDDVELVNPVPLINLRMRNMFL